MKESFDIKWAIEGNFRPSTYLETRDSLNRSSRVFAFLGMIYQKITVYLPVKRAQNPCLLRL